MSDDRRLEPGEVWGIRLNHEPGAPWFDIVVILEVPDDAMATAYTLTGDRFIPDFSTPGTCYESQMKGWERIL